MSYTLEQIGPSLVSRRSACQPHWHSGRLDIDNLIVWQLLTNGYDIRSFGAVYMICAVGVYV